MVFRLTAGRIDPAPMLARARQDGSGGVVLFLGRVRSDRTPQGKVRALLYEAYAPLAKQEMARLEREAKGRWRTERIEVVHRVGVVRVGEVSVAVLVSAAHRAQAFEASRYLIDHLKAEVPIWKTDLTPGGGARSRPRRPSAGRRRA